MEIDISILQRLTNLICENYIERNGQFININIDYFWNIDLKQAVKLSDIPDKFEVDSLEDDYNSLIRLLSCNREVNILDIDRISNIFKAISYETEMQKDKLF